MTDEDGILKNEHSGDENEPSTFISVTSHPPEHEDQEAAMTYEDDSFESDNDEKDVDD